MAALDAVEIKIFGLNVADDDGTTEFGSTAGGLTVYSDDPTVIQTAAWLEGWQDAVIAGTTKRLPVLQDMNSVHYVTTYGLSYLQQEGIGVWLDTKEYRTNSIVKKDGTSELYISLQDSNTNHALSDGAWWQQCGDLQYIPASAALLASGLGSVTQAYNSNLTTLTTSTLGDTIYSSGSNTLAKLSGNITTTKKFLTQTGNGAVSAAPGWNTIVIGDIPTGTSGATVPQNSDFVGMVAAFAVNAAPAGWLECDGSAVSRTTYASLFALIGTTFGSGNGTTTFNIPDLRGYFVRGWAHGGSVDSGRSFGSTQTDAFQGHYHNPLSPATNFMTTAGSGLAQGGAGYSSVNTTGAPVTDGTNGTPRTATETRPTNLALMYCIKY